MGTIGEFLAQGLEAIDGELLEDGAQRFGGDGLADEAGEGVGLGRGCFRSGGVADEVVGGAVQHVAEPFDVLELDGIDAPVEEVGRGVMAESVLAQVCEGVLDVAQTHESCWIKG